MSAPPSQAKPPDDDFVLWPDFLNQTAATANEAVIRRSLAGLAPTEWVEDPEATGPVPGEKLESGAKEERFYPASRQWFRTTTSIPLADASEKWWQDVPSSPPDAGTEPEPAPLPSSVPPASSEATASTELLSPEEIWELAAEELEQASRLRAPAANAAVTPSHPPSDGPGAVMASSLLPAQTAPAVPAPPFAPAAMDGAPAAPAPLAAMDGAPGAGIPVLGGRAVAIASVDELSSAAAPVTEPLEIPRIDPSRSASRTNEETSVERVTELPVVAPPAPVAARAVETSEWVQLPQAGAAAGKSSAPDPAQALPAGPRLAFPKAAPALSADPGVVNPSGGSDAPVAPAADDFEAAPAAEAAPVVERGRPPLDSRANVPPVEPLAAIPVLSRAPVSLRSETSKTPLPTQRRKSIPGGAGEPVFAELGMATGEGFVTEDPAVVAREKSARDEERSAVEPRRRRKRSESGKSREASPPRRSWIRWGAGTFGVLLIVTVVAAVVARDQLPSEWRRSADRWWRKAHQFIFPHQYGYPRRGVLSRPEPPAGTPSAASAADTAVRSPASVDSTEPSVVPPLVESPASAGPSPEPSSPSPAPPDSGPSSQSPKSIPGQPMPEAVTPPAPPPSSVGPSGEIIAPRAEPVPEDEEPSAPDADRVDAGPNPPPTGTATAAASAAAAPAGTGAAGVEEGPAPEGATETGGFTLWEGDVPAGTAGPAEGGAAGARTAPPAPASSEVAEGKQAVRSLVAARSVAEVLPWIFDADTLDTAVRAYYAQHPLQPLTDAVIEHEYSGIIPATGGKAHIFNVLAASHPRGFPVSAEATPQGYRIDWQSYIQWRDGWLQRFLISKSDKPQTLFVVLRRTHYFNDDVPQLDEKLAFKLTSAVPGDEGAVAFVDKNSAVGRSLAEMYEWRTMYFPVVELQWVPAGKTGQYLRLNRIVRPTWRRIGE